MRDEDLKEIRRILERCWSAETSYYIEEECEDRLSEGVRSFGQCYVTAKALKEVLGWRMVENKSVKHFWNKLPDGSEVDFTSDQFGGDGIRPIMTIVDPRDRFAALMGTPKSPARAKERYQAFLDCVRGPLESLGLRRQ